MSINGKLFIFIKYIDLKSIEPRAGKRKAIIIESEEQEQQKDIKEDKEEKEENPNEKEAEDEKN